MWLVIKLLNKFKTFWKCSSPTYSLTVENIWFSIVIYIELDLGITNIKFWWIKMIVQHFHYLLDIVCTNSSILMTWNSRLWERMISIFLTIFALELQLKKDFCSGLCHLNTFEIKKQHLQIDTSSPQTFTVHVSTFYF